MTEFGLDFDFFSDEKDDEAKFLASRERIYFDVENGADILSRNAKLPSEGESLRAISYAGGFSSCSVVLWIAAQSRIKKMYTSTLRVGKKEIDAMKDLRANGRIDSAYFILSGLSKNNKTQSGKDYGYTEYFESTCRECNFQWKYAKNHSKVILLNTDSGNT